MDKQDPSKGMVCEPDPETVTKLFWYLSGFFFLVAIVSAIGEVRGWWGFVGELGMTVGTLAGILFGSLSLLSGSSESQVSAVERAVLSNGATLTKVDERLVSMDWKLDKLDDLDKVQLELDVQTGVLGGQLAVLQEIRDGL